MIWTAAALCLLFHCILADGRRSAAAKVDELYSEAWTLRSRLGANASDYKLAASMLLEAAGLTVHDIKDPESIPHNFTGHRGTLRELAKALERGQGVPCNLPLSLRLFRRAAELGDPEAHGEMGTRFSYGLQDESSVTTNQLIGFSKFDLPQALLHFSFGAFGNDTASQMALGYRHMSGQGVPPNCRTAVSYYNAAAEHVIELGRMPGTLPYIEKVRLSVRSLHGLRSAKEQQWLQFYQYSADMGDVDAQAALGQLFNYGAHGLERDHQQALHYFRQAAEAGDAGAMSHLGHMYANGFGVEKDNSTALKWFKSAAAKNHPNGHYGLGYMYLAGYGVKKELKIAAEHFRKAAEMNHAEAQFHFGVMHLEGWVPQSRGMSPHQALQLFQAAAQNGHLLAMYNLAMMYLSGTGIEQPNCRLALSLLKQVAEKGPWCQVLQEGHDAFANHDPSAALLSYLRAAQMGLELGQSNAAWMLEHGWGPGSEKDNILLALQLYRGAAEQDNKEALLSIGDIHYYGRGVEKDWRHAAAVYRQASDKRNARAAFNLGFMHQYGAGLPQDLHLAKRFYDLAHDYEPDAYYAAKLTVLCLSVHSWWTKVRPYIPVTFRSPVDGLFTLRHADAPSIPTPWWSGRRSESVSVSGEGGIMKGIMEVMDIDAVGDFFQDLFGVYDKDEVGELVETLVLGVLVVVFMVVFRRRHQTRGNPQDRNTAIPRRGNGADIAPAATGADQATGQPQASAVVGGSAQPDRPSQAVEQQAVDAQTSRAAPGVTTTASMSLPHTEYHAAHDQGPAPSTGSEAVAGGQRSAE